MTQRVPKNAGVEFFIRNLSTIFSSGGVTVIFSTFESKLMHKISVTVNINWGFMFCIHLYMWFHLLIISLGISV